MRRSLALLKDSSSRLFSSAAAKVETTSSSSQAKDVKDALSTLRRKLEQGPDLGDFITGKELMEPEAYAIDAPSWKEKKRKPEWMKLKVPGAFLSLSPHTQTPAAHEHA